MDHERMTQIRLTSNVSKGGDQNIIDMLTPISTVNQATPGAAQDPYIQVHVAYTN